ncbi:MAG: amidohydrolase family protein [Thermoplasmatota archaeon]
MDLVVEGQLYVDGRRTRGCVGIEDGRIAAVKKVLRGERHVDYGDSLVFPGAVDPHVHFREPGQTDKEDFFSGSRAAALAGVTTALDMPNNVPSITDAAALRDKARRAADRICIDLGLYGGIAPGSDIEAMASDCIGFKIYLSGDNDIVVSGEMLPDILRRIRDADRVLAVHAEHRLCVSHQTAKSLAEHDRHRPAGCEVEGIRRMLKANTEVGARLHICHLSSPAAATLVQESDATGGVTPHHLLLSMTSSFKLPAMGKVNPPLRDEATRAGLWHLFRQGAIDVAESDHAPHLLEEKKDMMEAPSGMPGVDALMPLLLWRVRQGELPLTLVHRMCCRWPADIFGLPKGEIAPGRAADLLVLDFRERPLEPYSKCGWSPYEGWPAVYPREVFLHGERIVDDGEFVGEPGMGTVMA